MSTDPTFAKLSGRTAATQKGFSKAMKDALLGSSLNNDAITSLLQEDPSASIQIGGAGAITATRVSAGGAAANFATSDPVSRTQHHAVSVYRLFCSSH